MNNTESSSSFESTSAVDMQSRCDCSLTWKWYPFQATVRTQWRLVNLQCFRRSFAISMFLCTPAPHVFIRPLHYLESNGSASTRCHPNTLYVFYFSVVNPVFLPLRSHDLLTFSLPLAMLLAVAAVPWWTILVDHTPPGMSRFEPSAAFAHVSKYSNSIGKISVMWCCMCECCVCGMRKRLVWESLAIWVHSSSVWCSFWIKTETE